MKVAIISDLHSNREALEAVFDHIRGLGLSTIYCLYIGEYKCVKQYIL